MKSHIFSLLFFLPSVLLAAPVIDITKVAGKTKEEVESVLGKPDSTAIIKSGEKAHYTKGDIEIVFVRGKADWITVSALGDIPFSPKALDALGLKEVPPTFGNSNVLRWTSFPNILEVAIFPGQKNCDYAYIQVFTRPQ
jgi:hypothetical protein